MNPPITSPISQSQHHIQGLPAAHLWVLSQGKRDPLWQSPREGGPALEDRSVSRPHKHTWLDIAPAPRGCSPAWPLGSFTSRPGAAPAPSAAPVQPPSADAPAPPPPPSSFAALPPPGNTEQSEGLRPGLGCTGARGLGRRGGEGRRHQRSSGAEPGSPHPRSHKSPPSLKRHLVATSFAAAAELGVKGTDWSQTHLL